MKNIPRRCRLNLMVPAELAIHQIIEDVEKWGSHSCLTEAVVLLQQAKDKISDYVDFMGE